MGIAGNFVATGIGWYVRGPNTGLIIGAAGLVLWLAIYLFSREPKQQQTPSVNVEANPSLSQNFSPTFNPTIQIGVRDANATSIENLHWKHEELIIAFMKTLPLQQGHDYEFIAQGVGLSKRDTRDALDRLELQGRVWSTSVMGAPGGKAYFLDEVEH